MLYLIGVTEDLAVYSFTSHGIPPNIYQDAQEKAKKETATLLHKYGRICEQAGIKHGLLLGISNHVGEMITQAVDKKKIDFLFVGRRGMGTIKRIFVGSTSKYCVEHCNCNVMVVKKDWNPPQGLSLLDLTMDLEKQKMSSQESEKYLEDQRLKLEHLAVDSEYEKPVNISQ